MEEKFEQILDNVAILYQKYGVKSVSMDDVCKNLGISKKTLYEYVSEKEELVEKSLYRFIEKQIDYCKKIAKKDCNSIDELVELSHYLTKLKEDRNPSCEYDLQKYYPSIHIKLQHLIQNSSYDLVFSNLVKGKAEGLIRQDLQENIIARLHVSRIESLNNDDFFYLANEKYPNALNEVFIYHIRGIASEKGIMYLNELIKKNKIL